MAGTYRPSLYLKATACMKGYNDLLSLLENLILEQAGAGCANDFDVIATRETVLEELERFGLWARNIGALLPDRSQASLNFRLREDAELFHRTFKMLGRTEESLTEGEKASDVLFLHYRGGNTVLTYEAALITSGEKPNELWQVGSISDSDSEEGSQVARNEEVMETSELDELLSALKATNTNLSRMGTVLRNSPSRDDYLKATARYTFDPRYDIGHVREKYGSAKGSSEWLLERLAKAITIRRKYLKYRQEHHGTLSLFWDAGVQGAEVELDEEAEKLITQPKEILSNAKDASSRTGSGCIDLDLRYLTLNEANVSITDKDQLAFPSTPSMAFQGVRFEFGEPFLCPYCYTEQSVQDREAWKEHIIGDLRPYICTFRYCDLRLFSRQEDWFKHELAVHRRGWICRFCKLDSFPSRVVFKGHLESRHRNRIGSSDLDDLIIGCQKPLSEISLATCPLCDETPVFAMPLLEANADLELQRQLSEFRRHLGSHMEHLALFALPFGDQFEDDSDGNLEANDSTTTA